MANAINALVEKSKTPTPIVKKKSRRGFAYFTPRYPEYRSVIIQGNPAAVFVGRLPMGENSTMKLGLVMNFHSKEFVNHSLPLIWEFRWGRSMNVVMPLVLNKNSITPLS